MNLDVFGVDVVGHFIDLVELPMGEEIQECEPDHQSQEEKDREIAKVIDLLVFELSVNGLPQFDLIVLVIELHFMVVQALLRKVELSEIPLVYLL